MKNLLKLIVLVLVFSGCTFENKGNFNVSNKSDFDIHSVTIQPNSKEERITISKGKSVDLTTDMSKVRSDGSYLISFINSETGEQIERKFGYYTNGYQIEEMIFITIKNDTIDIAVENDLIIIDKSQ